ALTSMDSAQAGLREGEERTAHISLERCYTDGMLRRIPLRQIGEARRSPRALVFGRASLQEKIAASPLDARAPRGPSTRSFERAHAARLTVQRRRRLDTPVRPTAQTLDPVAWGIPITDLVASRERHGDRACSDGGRRQRQMLKPHMVGGGERAKL